MEKPTLHPRNVSKLRAIGGERTDYYDQEVPGLSMRVSPSGARVYSLRYRPQAQGNTQPVRLTLGDASVLTLAQARDMARAALAKVELGGDPQREKIAERRAAEGALTVAKLVEGWLAFGRSIRKGREGQPWRPKTRAEFERIGRKLTAEWGSRRADRLTRREVLAWAEGIAAAGSGIMANRYVEVFRLVLSWAVEQERIPAHPFPSIPKIRAERRGKEPYTPAELRRIFAAIPGTELADLVPVLLYTGVRSHEARAARWSDLDLAGKVWHVRAESLKGGQQAEPRRVPLSGGALRVLGALRARKVAALSPYVFPAATGACDTCGEKGHADKPNKSLADVRERAQVKGFDLHRCRHTVGQLLEDAGIAGDVIDYGVLGHARPTLRRTYVGRAGLKLHAEALDALSERLDAILAAGSQDAEARA